MRFSFLKKVFFFALFGLAIQTGFAQPVLLSKNARASVISCGTGNELYALFGHTAIRISDVDNGIDVVYNYGAFDFETANFALKFINGNLRYFAVANSYSDFISNYTYEKRAVYEQVLTLSALQRQKLFENLNQSLQLENREYTYKFITQNCTSMAVDVINKSLGQTVIVKKGTTDLSYRSILFSYFDRHFYEKLGTSIIFGTKTDRLGTAIFLPFELKESLDQVEFHHQPMVRENKTLLEFEPQTYSSYWNNPYSYLLFLGLILGLNKRAFDLGYLVLMALLGCFLTALWLCSSHVELTCNYNILLFNPSLLALVYFFKVNNKKGIGYAVGFHLVCLGVYVLMLLNKAHFWIVLPLIITNVLVIVRRFRQKNGLPLGDVAE